MLITTNKRNILESNGISISQLAAVFILLLFSLPPLLCLFGFPIYYLTDLSYITSIESELLSHDFRKGDVSRPLEGKYAIVKFHNHAELAYILVVPKWPGEAQEEVLLFQLLIPKVSRPLNNLKITSYIQKIAC